MAPRFHMGILIWKWGLTFHHMEMETVRFHMGITYRDPYMETENDTSPYGNGESSFPYGDQMKWLPISIRRSTYGNGDWHVPVSIWGLVESLTVTKQVCAHLGIEGKIPIWEKFPYGDCRFHMVIPLRKPKKFQFGDSPLPKRVCDHTGINTYIAYNIFARIHLLDRVVAANSRNDIMFEVWVHFLYSAHYGIVGSRIASRILGQGFNSLRCSIAPRIPGWGSRQVQTPHV